MPTVYRDRCVYNECGNGCLGWVMSKGSLTEGELSIDSCKFTVLMIKGEVRDSYAQNPFVLFSSLIFSVSNGGGKKATQNCEASVYIGSCSTAGVKFAQSRE